ncbi:MAG: hypothetical protein WCD75_10255 [Rhodoplanes sp.]
MSAKIKVGLVAAIVMTGIPCAAAPFISVVDYQNLRHKGGEGEKVIDIYIGAAIEAVGFANQHVIDLKQPPLFCQGDATITVRLVRDEIDRWINAKMSTMSPVEWNARARKISLAGATMFALMYTFSCR